MPAPPLVHCSPKQVWQDTVEELTLRGVSLDDILYFTTGLFNETWFDPARSTTRDVVFQAVIPATKSKACSYATQVNRGVPKKALVFVTHLWDNRFLHTVAALVADALGLHTYQGTAARLSALPRAVELLDDIREGGHGDKVYWFCPLSINQHKSVCDQSWGRGCNTVTGELYPECGCGLEKCTQGDSSEMNKFADLMASLHLELGLRHLVAVDAGFRVFTRAWCVAELVEVLKLHSPKDLMSHSKKLQGLSVRNCEATDPQDKQCILARIEDTDAFDAHLRTLLLDRRTGLLWTWQQAASDYILQWDELSPQYLEQLEAASRAARGWELLLVLLVPVILTTPFYSHFPFSKPDGSAQEAFWILHVWLPPQLVWVFIGNQKITCALAQLEWGELYALRKWSLIFFSCLLQPAALSCWWLGLRVWPLPWLCLLSTPTSTLFIVLLWWCVPLELRRQPAWRRRCFRSILACSILLVMWFVTGPVICAAMSLTQEFWILTLLASALLGQKLLCERLVKLLAAADVLPVFVWFSSASYELLLCIALCRGTSWYLLFELVGFDVAENCFHLWSIVRQHRDTGAAGALVAGKEQAILAQLLIREFVELTTPITFLAMLVALYLGPQKDHNDLVCHWGSRAFVSACLFVVVDFAVELLIALATWAVLRQQGKQPLRVLCGLVRQHLWVGVLWASINYWVRGSEQARLGGSDYRFEFLWMREEGAVWHCGLSWKINDV